MKRLYSCSGFLLFSIAMAIGATAASSENLNILLITTDDMGLHLGGYGDQIVLSIPMHIKQVHWPNHGISFERGPVVYSYPIADSSVIAENYKKSTDQFPAYDLYPAVSWQYSPRVVDVQDIVVTKNEGYLYPWNKETPPVVLKIPARKVENWELIKKREKSSGSIHYHIPGFPGEMELSEKAETIELIPYGCTRLRVTLFPQESDFSVK